MGWESGVAMSCGVGRGHGSDPALLWLWCRPVAAVPIRLLAWEPPYAVGVALTKTKKKKKQQQKRIFQILEWNREERLEALDHIVLP